MKNIIKSVIVMLSSISLFASANAGELSVTGTAKATYNILSGLNQNANKGIGVANEFNLGASGELDNGWSWNYSIAMDPGNTSTNALTSNVENDDSSLTLSTPYGTLGVFSMAGALDVEDSASKSVYGRPTDIGDPSATVDNFTIDAYNNLQYHSPAGLLPFGIQAKVAYAPGLDGTQNSANSGGAGVTKSATNMGDSATEYQVTATPIDGLKVGASYIEYSGSGAGVASQSKQSPESGAVYATYSIGQVSLGISEARAATLLSGATIAAGTVEWYGQRNMSIAFNVNDSLSVSYERETSETNKVTTTDAEVEQKSSAIQAAYTMGGMTFAVSLGNFDNNGYVANADAEQALFAVTMAF
jgi:hypothetical protein